MKIYQDGKGRYIMIRENSINNLWKFEPKEFDVIIYSDKIILQAKKGEVSNGI